MPTPTPEYLTEEIPPCAPVPGSSVDPCEPGASSLSGGGLGYAGSEPHGLRYYMELTSVHVAIWCCAAPTCPAPCGAKITESVSATRHTRLRLSLAGFTHTVSINCYADVRVNAYVLGSGPPTLTVLVYYSFYGFERDKDS